MKLFLQSSSGQPVLVLWEGGVVFERHFAMAERVDFRAALENALALAGSGINALDGIILDIGPGRLGATRSAVAFANGLAFALGIPLIPLSAFQVLGIYGEASHNRPCLVLRKAARRQYHWALVKAGEIVEAGFGADGTVSPKFQGPVAVVGDGDAESVALPSLPNAIWPGLTVVPGDALALLEAEFRPVSGPVVPLVDSHGGQHGNG